MVGTSDGVGAYAMNVNSWAAGGAGAATASSRAAALFLAMRSRVCSRFAATRSSSVLYLRGMMRNGIKINDDACDDGSCRWRQLSVMGMVEGDG
jgi:hypothetical protein